MEGDNRTFRVNNFTSDGVKRLREAINEKLKEFMGDYTDDTLVEYVIVLLKNGRSKVEAKSELNVFLGDDSDSFVSWLWDHLGSNLSLYVHSQDLPDGDSKTKATAGDEAEKIKSHQIDSEAEKGNSVKAHLNNRQSKGLVRDGVENEVPGPRNSIADNEISQDEPPRRVVRTKPSLSPRPTIHKKTRRTEEQRPRMLCVSLAFSRVFLIPISKDSSFVIVPINVDIKENEVEIDASSIDYRGLYQNMRVMQCSLRGVAQSTVGASRRLLQNAVRDAVATSRPSNATAEPSRKRLRSVVLTSTGDLLQEEGPQRIRRTSMSAAIKAAAEAVMDVTKVRPSSNVFGRLGHAIDVPNTTCHQEHVRVAEDVGDGGFSVETENFDLAYHQRIDGSRLQEENVSPFHDKNVLESDFGYDGEGYDVIDGRERDTTDGSWLGTSGRKWVEKSVTFQYDAAAADNVDERLHRPSKELGPPATGHNASLRIAPSVITRKSHYQEERDVSEMDNRKRALSSTVATISEVRSMKENNNPTLAFNGNAKPDTIQQPPEKSQIPTVLQNTGLPTEDADSRTIFVSNVHFAATKDSLSRHFNKFGEVLKVIILTDAATGQPKGSAYIEFMRKEAAELALSLDNTSFMSRLLKIVRKNAAQPEAAASVTTWPRIARASSPFPVPRFGRVPFARGVPNIYRARVPTKPGARNFQWKRGASNSTAACETSAQASSSIFPTPTARGLTYVRPEAKANGSSGTA
ncbi:polyadenylate-binding protein 2-a [Phtheirospermum japonicum]|uniref:Polyadenylate-binding protein 2-a n=1 Tax=Phtheirospermum japonicum TaxID=374723 RepID=A0A830C0B2_9LAMI|nr:polyadenylate-binding protein 2-a [Phtheirospermum japonicum]